MKERPILFSAPMVRAILEGRKTMTRRVVKLDPLDGIPAAIFPDGSGTGFIAWWGEGPHTAEQTIKYYPGEEGFKCPYGQPGDRLWVRETTIVDDTGICRFARYKADMAMVRDNYNCLSSWWYSKPQCPSIHMPRWASRITLRITDIRVERLQDISEEEAGSEGCHMDYEGEYSFHQRFGYRAGFMALWDSINGKRPGCSWESNPWVWVVEF